MKKRFFVIGDIHGMYEKFMSVMEKIDLQKEDYLVFLGDYGDKGNDSLKVMKYIYDLQKEYPHVYTLRGNHEDMFLDDVKRMPFTSAYAQNLIDSGAMDNTEYYDFYNYYYENSDEAIKMVQWVDNMPYHLELGNMHFSHAGCNPLRSQRLNDDYLWTRGEFLRYYDDDKMWFCGHTPIQCAHIYIGGEPIEEVEPVFLDNNIVMMDTGGFMADGKISCLDVLSGVLYQSDVM